MRSLLLSFLDIDFFINGKGIFDCNNEPYNYSNCNYNNGSNRNNCRCQVIQYIRSNHNESRYNDKDYNIKDYFHIYPSNSLINFAKDFFEYFPFTQIEASFLSALVQIHSIGSKTSTGL